jgi:hypothetical protein
VLGGALRIEISDFACHRYRQASLDTLLISATIKNKKALYRGLFNFSWRRDRDSNSGYLAARQFSRLLQSTTLPSLRMCGRAEYREVCLFVKIFLKNLIAYLSPPVPIMELEYVI